MHTGTLNNTNLVATVFAPTNAAFTALEKNLGYTPTQLLNSPILKPTLEYHVVPGVAAQVGRSLLCPPVSSPLYQIAMHAACALYQIVMHAARACDV